MIINLYVWLRNYGPYNLFPLPLFLSLVLSALGHTFTLYSLFPHYSSFPYLFLLIRLGFSLTHVLSHLSFSIPILPPFMAYEGGRSVVPSYLPSILALPPGPFYLEREKHKDGLGTRLLKCIFKSCFWYTCTMLTFFKIHTSLYYL